MLIQHAISVHNQLVQATSNASKPQGHEKENRSGVPIGRPEHNETTTMKASSMFVKALPFLIILFAACFSVQSFDSASNVSNVTNDEIHKNRPPLASAALYPLPLTAIQPKGWLKRQLRIQADGLSGHLDEVWSDVGPNSAWLGGTGEAWERGPYFLDGLVPLAYLLDDPGLKAKAEKWVNWTLSHPGEDGSIGPLKNQDWWPRMILLKALTQYEEATHDSRVIPLMQRYFAFQARELPKRPLQDWSKYRWQDEVLSIIWLYNRSGDPALLRLAGLLHNQGYDWKHQFDHFQFTEKLNKEKLKEQAGSGQAEIGMQTHGVNNAMALKASPVWSLISDSPEDRQAIYQQIKLLDEYHGIPNGMFSADEHFAGKDPSQGIELCAVVEAMFSYEQIAAILGDSLFGDRLEKVAFNALPGTFSSDMWAHQYDQQPNQIMCTRQARCWSTNGPDSNLYGLEPNFGCCTANMHQGWPKLAASLWMATADDGLAAVAYGPNEVNTKAGGTNVHITEDTYYPFREEVRLTIDPARPVNFPLKLRIPAWAKDATISLNGKAMDNISSRTYYIVNRRWTSGDRLDIKFPMPPRVSRWYKDSVAIERGPLVFSLKIGENWSKLDNARAPDWEVRPTTPWNYGLVIDPRRPQAFIQVIEKPMSEYPFSSDKTPVELLMKARRVTEWKMVEGSAGPLPQSPVESHEPEEQVRMVPYGSAKLRITAFPQIR
ncbi:MAG TPA: beta-L-arabinofuranosidase domain-containing protein [Candidatus Dormibacteraeota bacterium]|nr:beta-L-arabinofuranosidase domain-containing protein [Candidatus Dormibacteraeota bacterium]